MSIFSFPTHTRAHFAHKLRKITKRFQCGYKTETKLKYITHYAIFQNRRICASCTAIWLCSLCDLCILPYMHGLRSALVSVADQAAYAVLGRVGIERARA